MIHAFKAIVPNRRVLVKTPPTNGLAKGIRPGWNRRTM